MTTTEPTTDPYVHAQGAFLVALDLIESGFRSMVAAEAANGNVVNYGDPNTKAAESALSRLNDRVRRLYDAHYGAGSMSELLEVVNDV